MPKSSEIAGLPTPIPNREIEGLIARVEAATGPDRELDADLIRLLAPGATVGTYIVDDSRDIVFHAQALGIPNKMPAPRRLAPYRIIRSERDGRRKPI